MSKSLKLCHNLEMHQRKQIWLQFPEPVLQDMVISLLTQLNWQRAQLTRCCFGVLCGPGPGCLPRRWCGQLARLIPLVCS